MRTNTIWPSSDHGRAPEPEFATAMAAANEISALKSAIPLCNRIFTVSCSCADRNYKGSARQQLGDWRTRASGDVYWQADLPVDVRSLNSVPLLPKIRLIAILCCGATLKLCEVIVSVVLDFSIVVVVPE
jgi:hypothetical protein